MKKPIQTMFALISILVFTATVGILYAKNNEQRNIQLSYFASTIPTEPMLIDLNTATMEMLDSLPGIGPKLAQSILSYRQEHGGFRDYSELLNIEGIGTGRLEEILPLITLGGSQ